jgi:hypothetical protein
VVKSAPFRPERVMAPVLEILKSVVVAVAVEEPMAKRVVLVSPVLALMESFAYGVLVLMPTLPVEVTASRSMLLVRRETTPLGLFKMVVPEMLFTPKT